MRLLKFLALPEAVARKSKVGVFKQHDIYERRIVVANVVIVAIPEQDDYVWKISSEKIPHMTLLSLGEQEPGPKLAQMENYLQHAVETMMHKFGMSVERRDTLGPKDADVLLFDKGFCSKELKDFRDALLKNNIILDLYNGSPQFEEWIPHLTLGFPETPANPDERDYPGVHWVNFDKIALWVDDFDGPEFQLEGHDNGLMMSGLDLSQTVAHAEAKRPYDPIARRERYLRERKLTGRAPGALKDVLSRPAVGEVSDVKTDAQWSSTKNQSRINGTCFLNSAKKLDTAYAKILKKYDLNKLEDAKNNPKALKEFVDTTVSIMNTTLSKMKGSVSPSGKLQMQYYYNPTTHKVGLRTVSASAKHDDLEGVSLDQMVDVDPEDALQYGKLGMRWGVRNGRVSGAVSKGPVFRPKPSADRSPAEQIRMEAAGKKATRAINKGLPAFNRAYFKANPTSQPGKMTTIDEFKAYDSAFAKFAIDHLKAADSAPRSSASIIFGPARSKKELKIKAAVSVAASAAILGTKAALGHDDMNVSEYSIVTQLNDSGEAGSTVVEPVNSDLEQADSFGLTLDQKVQDIDAVQYGKLGMKWGVRRARGADGKVHGPVSTSDAAQAAAIRAKIGRKGNLSKLSNEEIQKLATRINLENNLARAATESSKLQKGHSAVKTGLALGKTANEAIKFYNSDAGQLLRSLVGQDAHGGKHNKLNQPVKKLVGDFANQGGKKSGKRKK
jgi:hypothetical protein